MVTDYSNLRHRWLSVIVLVCLVAGSMLARAQDTVKPASEKWRPRNGVYAKPGRNFSQLCGEYGDLVLELDRKKVGGMEWGCTIVKLSETNPGALKLDLVCEDTDTVWDESSSPDPDKRTMKEIVTKRNEIMTLRRHGDNTVLWNVTKDGKLEGLEWQSAYCPMDLQRNFFETRARDEAEAARKTDSK